MRRSLVSVRGEVNPVAQVPWWVYLLAAIATSGIVSVLGNRRRVKAEAQSATVQATNALAEGAREDVVWARNELVQARKDLMAAHEEAREERVKTAKARQRNAELETQIAVVKQEEGEKRHAIATDLLKAQARIVRLEQEIDTLRAQAGLSERRQS